MSSYEKLSSIIRSRAEIFADEHASVGSECTPMGIGYMGGWKDAIAHFSAIHPEVTIKHETSSITEAARIIDAHRENDRWVGDGVKIECVCGHVSHASGDVTHYPITETKNNHRDAERMHAAHVAQVLAAQEPTDAESIARKKLGDDAVDRLAVHFGVTQEPTAVEVEAFQDRLYERTLTWVPGVEVRAALSAARAARRDEENLGDAQAYHFPAPLDYLNDDRRDEEKR